MPRLIGPMTALKNENYHHSILQMRKLGLREDNVYTQDYHVSGAKLLTIIPLSSHRLLFKPKKTKAAQSSAKGLGSGPHLGADSP